MVNVELRYRPPAAGAPTGNLLILHDQEYHTSYWGHSALLGLTENILLPGYAGYVNTTAGSLQGRTQTLPLAIYAQFSGGDLEAALAIAALLVVVSAGLLAGIRVFLRARPSEGEEAGWSRRSTSPSVTV